MTLLRYGFLLFLFFLLLPGAEEVRSQKFPVGKIYGLYGTAFDPQTRTFYTIREDTIQAFRPPDYRAHTYHLSRPDTEFSYRFHPLCKDSTLYMVSKSGGQVYRLEGDSLRRIDRSFDHKMQINSRIFLRNDTIMRYGGYGFWSHRNFFTYYSDEVREWDVVPASGSTQLPRGSQNSWVTQDGKDMYVFSGEALNPANPLEYQHFNEVWRFDTEKQRWTFLGNLSQDFQHWFMISHHGNTLFFLEPKRRFALIDPSDNKITYYQRGSHNWKIIGFSPQRGDFHSYYADGNIWVLKWSPPSDSRGSDHRLYVEVQPWEGFLGPPVSEEPLYNNTEFPWKPIGAAAGLAGLLLLGFLSYRWYLERDKVVVTRNGVCYGRQRLDFSPKAVAVLRRLLSSPGEVPSQKVLDLVENPNLNPAHNMKIKNQLIDTLNFRFKTLMHLSEDPIRAARSKEDRRIKVYRMDKSRFILR